MKDETEIAVFEKMSAAPVVLGGFKVRKNGKESNQEQTWWDVGPVYKGDLTDMYFILEDKTKEASVELFVWHNYPGNRDEPPSCEERSLGQFHSLGNALEEILSRTLREVVQDEREKV